MPTSQQLSQQCSQTIYLHGKTDLPSLYQTLSTYAQANNIDVDHYGKGHFLNEFEDEVAQLLGKEAAVFMPSGVLAQQIALRIHADSSELPQIAYHPTCHMEINEHQGYHYLHGLQANLLGERHRLIAIDDLDYLEKPISTLLLELPQRWCGGLIPQWDALRTLINQAKNKASYCDLDGARLWECTPYYEKSLSDICRVFDSVYVSFYKTLGGISGAMLAGEATFINTARVWLKRQGGNLHQLHPYAITAKMYLDQRLPMITDYVERASQIARLLQNIDNLICFPEKPQTNMFHVHLPLRLTNLENNRDEIARQAGIWMCGRFYPSYLPRFKDNEQTTAYYMEVHIGDVLLQMPDEQITSLFTQLAE